MSTVGEFIKVLGVMMLFVLLVGGVLYWIRFAIKNIAPNFKYWLKYKLLRIKHSSIIVEMLMEDLENNVSEEDLEKTLLLSGKATPKQCKEILYIYKNMKKSCKEVKTNE